MTLAAELKTSDAQKLAEAAEQERARLVAELATRSHPAIDSAPGDQAGRLQTVETERDQLRDEVRALQAALDRTKQHVNILQTRRDQMRDEIAKLKVVPGRAD